MHKHTHSLVAALALALALGGAACGPTLHDPHTGVGLKQVDLRLFAGEIIGRLKLIGDEGLGLIKLDEDLGQRPAGSTEAPPA